jgi:hypothetical protein
METPPEGAKLFHMDGHREGQTDMTKLIVTSCNFANSPKNKWFTRSFVS